MVKDGLVNAAGSVLRLLMAVVSIPVLVDTLGLTTFGQISLLIAIINVGTLSEIGLSTSTTIHVGAALGSGDSLRIQHVIAFTLAAALTTGGITATLILSLAPLLSVTFLGAKSWIDPVPTVALVGGAVAVVARVIFQVLIGILQASQRFKRSAALQTTWFCATQCALVLVAQINRSLAALGLGIAIAALLSLSLAWVTTQSCIRLPRPRLNVDREIRRDVLKSCVNIGVTNLANALFNQCDKLVVGLVLSPASVGIYSAFTNIAAQINTVSAAVCQPVLSQVAKMNAPQRKVLTQHFGTAFSLCALTIAWMAVGIIMLLELAMPWIFSQVPATAYGALVLLICAYSLFAINAPAYYVLQATGSAVAVRNTTLASGAAALLSVAVLAHFFGLIGASCGNFAFSLMFLLTRRVAKETGCTLRELAIPLSAMLAIPAAIACWRIDLKLTGYVAAVMFLATVLSLTTLLSFRKSQRWAIRLNGALSFYGNK